jgi:hypothetical protein
LDEIPGRHLSSGKFTGQWTRTELEKYALAMGKFGDDWQRIAEEVGTREMRQCRDRYHYVERQQRQQKEKLHKKPEKGAKKHPTVTKPVYTEDRVRIQQRKPSGSLWNSLINSQNTNLHLTSKHPKEFSEISEISELSLEDHTDTEDSDSEAEPAIYKCKYRHKLRSRIRYPTKPFMNLRSQIR